MSFESSLIVFLKKSSRLGNLKLLKFPLPHFLGAQV